MRRLREHWGWVVLIPAVLLLAAGIVAAAAGQDGVRDSCWLAAGVLGVLASGGAVVRGLIARTAGVDVLAFLAVLGALLTHEYLAAALITVMLGTGTVLDQWAEASARRELKLLLARSPRNAHRWCPQGSSWWTSTRWPSGTPSSSAAVRSCPWMCGCSTGARSTSRP